ncbi:hypothetical protein ACOCEA_04415 [Maribacter sp. CXY002]|uniref:hypothetical protein n=1 Tax=Maribacter luteocoastalis TaxID=3407671 RepID=UPI003B67D8F1
MISSIFGKTKPINFIILMGFLFVFYWTVQISLFKIELDTESVILKSLVLSVLLFSVFVVDFIIKRNKITSPNSYGILYFTLLILVFPETLNDNNAIVCSFFLLLAIRRLLSIKSLKNIKVKIFDASLWILMSSIFYNWAILFLILVFVSIYIYDPKNIRNWLVVIAATFCYFVLLYAVLTLINLTNYLETHYNYTFNNNVLTASYWTSSVKMLLYTIINIFLGSIGFLRLGKSGVGKITTLRLVSLSFVLGLLANLLLLRESNSAILITFFPAVIFITNYLESLKRKNVLEVILMLSVFVPLIVFISKLLIS